MAFAVLLFKKLLLFSGLIKVFCDIYEFNCTDGRVSLTSPNSSPTSQSEDSSL